MAEGKGGAKSAILGLVGGIIGSGAIVAALIFGGVLSTAKTGTSTAATTSDSSGSAVTINASGEDATLATAVASKVLPSVVSITATGTSSGSIGSGSIYDTNGNIITNYHVIDGATDISVSLSDGTSYSAELVGSDKSSDLAVIKIDAGDTALTAIELGDSSELQVGDWVMCAGSPFGLDQSVSTGIVSSMYRDTMLSSSSGDTIYTNLIQTDAAVNPGNSGGPLVNAAGKMIGVNSIIESYSGSSSGVGFAIPSNYVKNVADTIIAGKTVTHAYLGGKFATVNAANAARNNLSVSSGAYVSELDSDGPAAAAGIEQGDIITEIGEDKVTSSDGLVLAVRSHSTGDKVTVKVMRGTEEKSFEVTLGSDEKLQSSSDSSDSSSDSSSSDMNSLLEELLNEYYGGNSGNSGSSNGLDGYGYDYGYGYGYGNNNSSNTLS